jgi:regulatory protein
MKLTAIKAQQKSQSRVSLYFDDKFFCGLDMLQLAELRLHVGQEFTEAEAEKLKQEGEFSKAYNRVLNFLAIRPRSTREVRDYLVRKEYNKAIQERVLQRITEKDYINDETFAESWARSRAATKPVSKRRLQAELSAKGVKNEQQVKAIEAYDERAALRRIIEKKRRHSRYQDPQKFLAYLARQGFSYDLIKETLEESTTDS